MGVTGSAFVRQALDLARSASFMTSPNPRVGCVIVGRNGDVLGIGHTQPVGQPHAEIMALGDASGRGHDVAGATAYVTLEPCSHHGRTGPCCDALIAAGIGAVVASITDPNPLVAGQGFARLKAAGIKLEIGPGSRESRELNLGFFSRMIRKAPWVRMKIAASLDGKIALENGQSQWITSEEARADGHAWRARSCAILTGIGTVLADNPRLDVRLVSTPRQPLLVVVDSQLETPLDAHIFIAGRALLIYTATRNDQKKNALEARGATVIEMPQHKPVGIAKVDLQAMLGDVAARQINEIHVEAGQKLNSSLIREGLVDELLVYLAPKLIGQGQGMVSTGPLEDLGGALPLDFQSVDRLGPDLRVLARVVGRDTF
jgi:diaminohydroxyphosphoribosylaminopyrimidine deaminase / 5-amino-6-(5-phosphoribosylamino)uracil reductase